MLFLTNYKKVSAQSQREAGKEFNFEYDCSVENPEASDFFYCVETDANGVHYELGLEEFFEKIHKHPFEKILFYIHGFNTVPERILSDVKKLQKFTQLAGYLVVPIL